MILGLLAPATRHLSVPRLSMEQCSAPESGVGSLLLPERGVAALVAPLPERLGGIAAVGVEEKKVMRGALQHLEDTTVLHMTESGRWTTTATPLVHAGKILGEVNKKVGELYRAERIDPSRRGMVGSFAFAIGEHVMVTALGGAGYAFYRRKDDRMFLSASSAHMRHGVAAGYERNSLDQLSFGVMDGSSGVHFHLNLNAFSPLPGDRLFLFSPTVAATLHENSHQLIHRFSRLSARKMVSFAKVLGSSESLGCVEVLF